MRIEAFECQLFFFFFLSCNCTCQHYQNHHVQHKDLSIHTFNMMYCTGPRDLVSVCHDNSITRISEYKSSVDKCNCSKTNVLTQECHTVRIMLHVSVLCSLRSSDCSVSGSASSSSASARAQSCTRLTVNSNSFCPRAPRALTDLLTHRLGFTPFPCVSMFIYFIYFFYTGVNAVHIRCANN